MKENNWLDIAEVRAQVELAAQHVVNHVDRNFRDCIGGMLPLAYYAPVESPLEAIFWIWWNAYAFSHDVETRFVLDCQHPIACSNGQDYRVDFVLTLRDRERAREYAAADAPFPMIGIEVDGHAFHEKTKEQVAYRNQRDRALQQDKWTIFHFSWMELVSAGADHVGEVIDFAVVKQNECEAASSRKWARDNPEKLQAALGRIQATE